MAEMNLQTATLPVTAVLAIVMMFGGWWVKSQDRRITDVVEHATRLEAEINTLKLQTTNDINQIKTSQAVNSEKLEQINKSIQRLIEKEGD